MNHHDTLFAVMEFGVGIGGFAGVAFAIIHRSSLTPVDRFRIFNLLYGSLGAAFFALVPILLEAASLSSDHTWRLTSALLIAFTIFAVASVGRSLRGFSDEQRKRLSRPFFTFSAGLFLLGTALLACNVVGWPFEPRFAPVLFSLLSMLLLGVGAFIRLLSQMGSAA